MLDLTMAGMKPILTFYIVCVFEVLMTLGNLVGFMTYIY